MPIQEAASDAVVTGGTNVALSSFFAATSGADPAYLIVDALDRDEYTVSATGATGDFSAEGKTLSLSNIGQDGRGAGIVYTYQAATGTYVNATYGTLSQLDFTASASQNDVTNISLFGTGNLALADAYANNAYALMQTDAGGYLGSATVVTQAATATTKPAGIATSENATPDKIAAAAQSFVGDAWNLDGCWVLASSIAAEAGASLPVQSTSVGTPGAANGEWKVLYDGSAGSNANWTNLVSAGDVVAFVTASGGGHITTCVSGSGGNAQLIDNITYENSNGGIVNPANDGSPNDILVSAAHPASQEFNGVNPQNVVVYALDTPVVATLGAAATATTGTPLALSKLASGSDPFGTAITAYQVYDSLNGATIGGANTGAGASAHSAATAATAASLSGLTLNYTQAGTDTVDIRAFNGAYWGDWQTVTVTVAGATASPPKLAAPTAAQNWAEGSKVSLTLPSGTFTDPQNEKLTLSATLASGAALPGWLTFNAGTNTFSGTAPTTAQSLSLKVTATDTSGLSAAETFTATIAPSPPKLALQTGAQSWAEASKVSLTLPGGTFTDPQNQKLTLRATLASGAALPGWLTFNAGTGTFSGTAPTTAESLGLKVTATDTSGLSAAESFTATITPSAPKLAFQTPNQTWAEGAKISDTLRTGTFTDPQQETLTLKASLASGAALPAWLSFNAGTDTFSGTAPTTAQSLSLKVTATDTSGLSVNDVFTATIGKASGAAGFAPPVHGLQLAEVQRPLFDLVLTHQ